MGNCQAAEAATVVIQHPGGGGGGRKVERIYWSVRANEVMASNPGHYVALVISSTTATVTARTTENGIPVKQLKLLRPNDTLFMGQVYRLVTFQEVAKEYAAKKCVKLGKLLKESGGGGGSGSGLVSDMNNTLSPPTQQNRHEVKKVGNNSNDRSRATRGGGGQRRQPGGGGGPWKPALHSISEIGT